MSPYTNILSIAGQFDNNILHNNKRYQGECELLIDAEKIINLCQYPPPYIFRENKAFKRSWKNYKDKTTKNL